MNLPTVIDFERTRIIDPARPCGVTHVPMRRKSTVGLSEAHLLIGCGKGDKRDQANYQFFQSWSNAVQRRALHHLEEMFLGSMAPQ